MEEQAFNDVAEQAAVHGAINQQQVIQNQTRQLQYQMEEGEKNLAESQLDVEQTLTKINHLLNQDVLRLNSDNVLDWETMKDETKRVLTGEGVDKIMQIMQSYINKETLLSNFDEDTINRRMLEFSLALSALIFLKYEIFFRQPTIKECHDKLDEKIKTKLKEKEMMAKLLKKDFNEAMEEKIILDEIGERMEYEIQKIKSEKIKTNLKEFEMLFVQLRALVEATHHRAYRGEERGSLRRHFNISEVIGGSPSRTPEKKGGFFGWGRK